MCPISHCFHKINQFGKGLLWLSKKKFDIVHDDNGYIVSSLDHARIVLAEIEGELKSRIAVEGLLRLRETAVLLGDIETGKLAIEPGASFTGNCKMGAVVKNLSDKKSSQKAATA